MQASSLQVLNPGIENVVNLELGLQVNVILQMISRTNKFGNFYITGQNPKFIIILVHIIIFPCEAELIKPGNWLW